MIPDDVVEESSTVEWHADTVLTADLHDVRNRLDYWYPRLPDSVPTPETHIFKLDHDVDGIPDLHEGGVVGWMHTHGYEHAFIRSMYKSAEHELMSGSHIHRPTVDAVRRTYGELMAQHAMMRMPTGNRIAAREWLDLDYCPEHSHVSEVRFFINRGDVVYWAPDVVEILDTVMECESHYSYVPDNLRGLTPPVELAGEVASVFDEHAWSVDFALTAQGGWYLIDMGLDGLYYNEREDEWMDISQHPDSEHSNLHFVEVVE